ncbi:Hypothetical predicted protein [Olea europaea subsp. europaea]|uniref:Uncharacterized protein n=1 Tax=Olea europaea subsp. europaea TaxID=158383 RepID=A0A8S0TJV4_OLEEU|nr:Hypothetical predicted protein [Olea europaea subsp. europaea]
MNKIAIFLIIGVPFLSFLFSLSCNIFLFFKLQMNSNGEAKSNKNYSVDKNLNVDLINSAKQPVGGSGHGGFTSLRAESMRACGLAARMKASQGTNGKSHYSRSEDPSLVHHPVLQNGIHLERNSPKSGWESNDEHLLEKYNEDGKESRTEKRFKVGSTTVRKLFMEDRIDEVKQSDAGQKHTDDTAKLFLASKNCFAGFGYANSQEPGELSQATAQDQL